MKVNKRGQFYFIGALVVILVLISFAVLNNTSNKKENPELKNIQEELDLEIGKTLEYIANNGLSENEAQDLFKNFSLNYMNKIGYNKNIIFMFGQKQGSLILKGYKLEDSENITIVSGSSTEIISAGEFEETIATSGNNISLTSGESVYMFDLFEGQNFYYFITKEYKGEKQIIKG